METHFVLGAVFLLKRVQIDLASVCFIVSEDIDEVSFELISLHQAGFLDNLVAVKVYLFLGKGRLRVDSEGLLAYVGNLG